MGAKPQARELKVNRPREMRNILLRPKLSLRFPASGIVEATPIRNTEIVHAVQSTLEPSSLMKLGKATATTVPSMEYIRSAKPAQPKMR